MDGMSLKLGTYMLGYGLALWNHNPMSLMDMEYGKRRMVTWMWKRKAMEIVNCVFYNFHGYKSRNVM